MSGREARSHVVVRIGPARPAGAAPVTDWPRLAEAGRGWPRLEVALRWLWRWRGVLGAGRAGGPSLGTAASPHGLMLWRRWLTKSTMSSRRVHPHSRACTMTWSTAETRWCSAFGPRRPSRGKALPRQAALPRPRSAHRPRLTLNSGPPRPIGRLGRAGRTHRPSCRHTRPLRSTRTGVARSRSWAAEQAWAPQGPRRVSRCRPRSTSWTW